MWNLSLPCIARDKSPPCLYFWGKVRKLPFWKKDLWIHFQEITSILEGETWFIHFVKTQKTFHCVGENWENVVLLLCNFCDCCDDFGTLSLWWPFTSDHSDPFRFHLDPVFYRWPCPGLSSSFDKRHITNHWIQWCSVPFSALLHCPFVIFCIFNLPFLVGFDLPIRDL